jgi:hypothetical protein
MSTLGAQLPSILYRLFSDIAATASISCQVLGEALSLMRATLPTSIRVEEAIAATPSHKADP